MNGTRPAGPRATGALLAGVLVLALAARLFASAMAFSSTFDTSTVGLMAMHILKGERPLFYYGQSYMGALEAYAAAGLFAVFGVSILVLSLAPILFSLAWIAATYGLFCELAGRRAGLAAALCLAVPGWVMMWYCIGSYGGYPGAFFFGTLALWLMVRVTRREMLPGALWLHAIGAGTAAALGLWTHYLAAPYVLTGAAELLPWFWRRRFAPRALLPWFVAAALGAAGLAPAWIVRAQFGGEHALQWAPTLRAAGRHALELARTNLPELIVWRMKGQGRAAAILNGTSVAAALILVALAAVLLWMELRGARPERWRRLGRVSVLFGAFFLLGYLPHELAGLHAPRYAIPLVAFLLCVLFAVPAASEVRRRRVAAALVLGGWLAYNGTVLVAACMRAAPEATRARTQRERVVALAENAGLKHVAMVGGRVFGHSGQTYSLYARDRVRFVSVMDERYQPAAQAIETDTAAGLACETHRLPYLRATLDALGVRARAIEGPRVTLLSHLRLPCSAREAILPARMRVSLDGAVEGAASFLTDRSLDTAVAGDCSKAAGFTIDLGEPTPLDSLWLCPADPLHGSLPNGYALSVSDDGREYRRVALVDKRWATAYVCGGCLYLEGYYGVLECRLDGRPARFLRFAGTSAEAGGGTWQAAELFVFRRTGEGMAVDEREAREVAAVILKEGVEFTACDRWLSAELLRALPERRGRPPAYPRFNPKHKATQLSREVRPVRGMAVAVARELEAECAAVLATCAGAAAGWETIRFPHYVLFVFTDSGGVAGVGGVRMVWNGQTLLAYGGPLWVAAVEKAPVRGQRESRSFGVIAGGLWAKNEILSETH